MAKLKFKHLAKKRFERRLLSGDKRRMLQIMAKYQPKPTSKIPEQ
jgi:hypothetical protein